MTMTIDGNVGIGTMQPKNVRLTVQGKSNSNETVFRIKEKDGTVVFEIGY
jgi:hypothetical protein